MCLWNINFQKMLKNLSQSGLSKLVALYLAGSSDILPQLNTQGAQYSNRSADQVPTCFYIASKLLRF